MKKYTCYFYIYNAAKDNAGEDPYEESNKLSFDNLESAVIAAFEDRGKTSDYKDYGGAVVVNNENKVAMFEIMRNGDIEGGYLEMYPEVKKIVEAYENNLHPAPSIEEVIAKIKRDSATGRNKCRTIEKQARFYRITVDALEKIYSELGITF